MSRFEIAKQYDPEKNPFDRQQRIGWWSQEALLGAKVLVVGAGAIGNETLKNLALLGFGHLFVVDFDEVNVSNLSRTVLFRREDEGRRKAQVAAERCLEFCTANEPVVAWFHGDVVWELGTGIFRDMDLVLGCLDNVEARRSINRRCWHTNTPWIDSGIYELAARVDVYQPPVSACYECNLNEKQLSSALERYSCDNFKRRYKSQGLVPTVQVAAAIASAIQVQEAIKMLCGQEAAGGRRIFFQGLGNDFDVLGLQVNEDCPAHSSLPQPTVLSLGQESTVRELLEQVSHPGASGPEATLDLRGELEFVVAFQCRTCGRRVEALEPSFRIYDLDAYCKECGGDTDYAPANPETLTSKEVLYEINLASEQPEILDLSLARLGVPYLHVLPVRGADSGYRYYELGGDRERVFTVLTRREVQV